MLSLPGGGSVTLRAAPTHNNNAQSTKRRRLSFIGGRCGGASTGIRANGVASSIVCASSALGAYANDNNMRNTVADDVVLPSAHHRRRLTVMERCKAADASLPAMYRGAHDTRASVFSDPMPPLPPKRTTTHRLKAIQSLLGTIDASLEVLTTWTCPEAALLEALLLQRLLDVSHGAL